MINLGERFQGEEAQRERTAGQLPPPRPPRPPTMWAWPRNSQDCIWGFCSLLRVRGWVWGLGLRLSAQLASPPASRSQSLGYMWEDKMIAVSHRGCAWLGMLSRFLSLRVLAPHHLGLGKIKGQESCDLRNRVGVSSVGGVPCPHGQTLGPIPSQPNTCHQALGRCRQEDQEFNVSSIQ